MRWISRWLSLILLASCSTDLTFIHSTDRKLRILFYQAPSRVLIVSCYHFTRANSGLYKTFFRQDLNDLGLILLVYLGFWVIYCSHFFCYHNDLPCYHNHGFVNHHCQNRRRVSSFSSEQHSTYSAHLFQEKNFIFVILHLLQSSRSIQIHQLTLYLYVKPCLFTQIWKALGLLMATFQSLVQIACSSG